MTQTAPPDTKESILDAAQECFAQSGFGSTNLRQVAQRAGVTPPLILHYFGSKAELFEAVLRRVTHAYDARQAVQWAREADDTQFFVEALRVLFDWLGEMRTTGRLVIWARLEGRLPRLPEIDQIAGKAAQRVRDAQAMGVVRADVEPEVMLAAFEALYKGFWDRVDEFGDRGVSPDAFLQLSFELFLPRLLTPRAFAEAEATLRGQTGAPISR